MNIYDFEVENLKGEKISLETYKGKALLIVNTASRCGFTPQLESMEKLRSSFDSNEFEVLAFPTNDFGGQEPLDGEAIGEFCTLKYNSTFPVFNKIKVKGEDAHPLYKFLSSKKLNGRINSKPKWNFHKYLINKKGEVVDYFLTTTSPNGSKIKRKIKALL